MFVDSLHIFSFFLLTFVTILLTFLMKTSRVETRSLPALARCYPRSFTFYVAHPARSILTSSLKVAHCFTLITRTTPCLRQLPSCVSVYPRDSRSRRVLCLPRRSISEGGSLIPFSPFAADTAASTAAQLMHRLIRSLSAFSLAKEEQVNENA